MNSIYNELCLYESLFWFFLVYENHRVQEEADSNEAPCASRGRYPKAIKMENEKQINRLTVTNFEA